MLYMLPGIIIAISFHEFAHAWVSDKLGDPTPRAQGRVTISPFAHIDPIGLIMLLFLGFGFGRPVQVDPKYYKNRRRGELLVSLAGVAMNFLLATVLTVLFNVLLRNNVLSYTNPLLTILQYTILINITLCVFNLIPIPPLDGYKVVKQVFLGGKTLNFMWTLERYGFFILLAFLFLNRYFGWIQQLASLAWRLIDLLVGWI